MPTTMQITAPPLHLGGQRDVVKSDARFRVICAGRRWGKTRLGAALATMEALAGGHVWWVAPTYPIAAIAWRQFKILGRQLPEVEPKEVERMIEFPYAGWLQVKSAEHPAGLRGEGLDLLIVDEAAHIRQWREVWEQALRPALSDRQGKAIFISSPAGFNHFYELHRVAQTADNWAAWTFPSWTNPYLAPEEIEQARAQLPALVFRQEYGAEFVQLEGALFRREWANLIDNPAESTQMARYWDLAAGTKTHNDYTCGAKVALMDDGKLVLMDVVRGRWEWPDALKIIRQTALSDGPKVKQGIEDVGVQKGLYQLVMREPSLVGISFRAMKVVSDKITRANPWIARAEQGKFAMVRAAWNAAFLDEACAFPESTHDDQVDAVSGATAMLASRGWTWAPVGR